MSPVHLMIAELVAVGTELSSGEKLDTNSQWLARRLAALGIETRYHTTVDDDAARIVDVFRNAARRATLVVISGGLGPTQDDLTRESLATFANVPLVEDPESRRAIEAYFAGRQRPMPARNRVQALLPEGAEALPNACGTAPGIWMTAGPTTFIALPGVPNELHAMFDEQVVPRLRVLNPSGRVLVRRVINLFGRGEAEIEAAALDLTARGRRPEVGITASDATISFRIWCDAETEEAASLEIETTARAVYERFGELIVGEAESDVPEALAAELARTGTTLAIAESCTGGLAAARLTEIAGISAYFVGGVVSYSNESKTTLLGVPADLIEARGAVSAEVAEAMAAGVRERLRADVGVSITGIAGPGGGSAEKPVGLVYLGLATSEGVEHRRLLLGSDQPRAVIRSRAAKHALNWVRLEVKVRGAKSAS